MGRTLGAMLVPFMLTLCAVAASDTEELYRPARRLPMRRRRRLTTPVDLT